METGRAPSHVALNRKDLELLCSKISDERITLPALLARFMFLDQQSDHPHRGKIWTKGVADFKSIELGGTAPHWSKPAGEPHGQIRFCTKDGREMASYLMYFNGSKEALERFWQHASTAAKLLLPDAEEPTWDYFQKLIEFCRMNDLLKWEVNQQPDHPEKRGQIAWLHDLFAATIRFLNAQMKSPECANEVTGATDRSADDGSGKPDEIVPTRNAMRRFFNGWRFDWHDDFGQEGGEVDDRKGFGYIA